MRLNSKLLPPNITRRMPKDARKQFAVKLPEEIEEANAATLEKKVRRDVWNILRLRRVRIITARTDRKSTLEPGTPDFCFMYLGFGFAWELKRPKNGILSPEQITAHEEMRGNGWRVSIITSVVQASLLLNEVESA